MSQKNLNTLLSLEKQIAAARRKLQELYDAHGATTPEVLAAGIELDETIKFKDKRVKGKKKAENHSGLLLLHVPSS